MIHIILHFLIPPVVALVFYYSRWRNATFIMIATMLVDIDHLLANPIYDPTRCSIGFHPLHTLPFIIIYTVMFAVPLLRFRNNENKDWHSTACIIHLLGLGLLIHMTLDWLDCFI
ncbi:DUF6122 family protein [Gracilimonas sp.]|uniref:DUF6122 family protein n=1 Tax=Gracilimonas sp. TaxID=1974203 RepID=UPI0028712AF0|nr:DUF6122 family protein [Gracilimonas sp.]